MVHGLAMYGIRYNYLLLPPSLAQTIVVPPTLTLCFSLTI